MPPTEDVYAHRSDEDLLAAVARGDTHAFEALYQRHWRSLLIYLVGQLSDPALAEETLQDVMLAAWDGADRFRGEARVSTWLLAIARRQAVLARRREPENSQSLDHNLAGDDPTPTELVEHRAARSTLHDLINQLPAHQRETLELVFYHELTGPEAARVLGVPLGTVKSRLRRAIDQLERLFRLEDHHA